jgi:hypothetical protein
MAPERATLTSELQRAADVQPDHSATQARHVAIQQHGAIRAAATTTPAEPAEASQSAQQPHHALHDAATPPETDGAAQQPEPEAPVPVPGAVVSCTPDLSASPDAPPPTQQQPTAKAAPQRSGHTGIPAAPQQQLVSNPKRTAAAPPMPPSPARPCSLSDTELSPQSPAEAAHAAQPQQPPDSAAAKPLTQLNGPEQENREQEQQQDVQEATQCEAQGRQGSHDEVGVEQPQQPEAELGEQQAQGAAPAHRRNTPYICQVGHSCSQTAA